MLGSHPTTQLCPTTALGFHPTTPSATTTLCSQATTTLGSLDSTTLCFQATTSVHPPSGNTPTTSVPTQELHCSNLTSLLGCCPTDSSRSTPQNYQTSSLPIRHLFENGDSFLSENDDDERQLEEATLHELLKHTEDAAFIPLKTKMPIAISKAVGIDNTLKRFDEI